MMSTELIFSPSKLHNPATGIQRDKIGSYSFDRSSKNQATPESSEDDGDNFLTTLKQVSQNRTQNKHSQHAGEGHSSGTAVAVVGGEIEKTSDQAAASVDLTVQNEKEAKLDQMASDLNFLEFIKALEELGLHDAIKGCELQKVLDENPTAGTQLLSNALEGNFPLPTDIKSELLMGEGASGAKPSGTLAAKTKVGIETAVRSLDPKSDAKGTGIFQAVASPAVASQSENRNEVDSVKSASDTGPLDSKTHQNAKAINSVDIIDADASKIKETLVLLRDPRAPTSLGIPSRMVSAPDQDQQHNSETTRDSQSIKPSASSGINPAAAKVSASQDRSITGEEPLSKVVQEIELLKEGSTKVKFGISEETASKVIKSEGATHDNGLLNSSGQSAEKVAETVSLSKETEASQSSLRNPTIEQFVRKAAMHLRNGQHEARIDLKPDFLGHIRMQVISENQQVTVRIQTEHGFVKNMIENNFHQLKADLQQQGLEIDKLEVSLSRDPEDSGNLKEKFASSKAKQSTGNHQKKVRPTGEQQKDTRQPPRTADGTVTVDYFA